MLDGPVSILDIFAKYGHLIGWSVFLGFIWNFRGILDKYVHTVAGIDERTQSTEKMTMEVKDTVESFRTNHFVHLDESLKDLHERQEKHIELLSSIDKGIGILCDRDREVTVTVQTGKKKPDPVNDGME